MKMVQRQFQNKCGKYITMELDDILYIEEDVKEKLLNSLAEEISKLIGKDKTKSVLVVRTWKYSCNSR